MGQRKRILKDLSDFLRIPSVSTFPEHASDVRQAADWLVNYLQKMGLESGVVQTDGHPLVWGSWHELSDKPTLLLYGHYDVQPPDPLEEWKSPPFEPTVRGEKLFARGAADNKGQLFISLTAAKQLLEERGDLPINLVFAVEGEEEVGSPHFSQAMEKAGKRLVADVALVTDAGIPKADHPVIVYSLRGIIAFEVVITGPARDLHSGSFGGMIANPAQVLVTILAELKDKEGRVAIPGFYDQVIDPSSKDKEVISQLPRKEEDERNEAGVKRLISEPGYAPQESAKVRPSLDINGLISGFTGEGMKTIIPAKARAKFTMRLVPNQKPKEIMKKTVEFIESLCPDTVDCQVKVSEGSPAVRVDPQSKFAQLVGNGLEAVFGRQPVFNLMGGSIAAAGVLDRLGLSPIMTGFTLPDSRIHAPNENLDLPHFFKGIEAIKEILEQLQSL
jgi:acetylornithine deacetylase/succinyl-diaminopimelate desuccinylase-like protein